MPLFFFHLRNRATIEVDEEGVECADLETAYLEAVRAIPGVAADLIAEGSNPMDHVFEIADGEGTLLLDVPFTETLRGTSRKMPLRMTQIEAKTLLDRAQDLSVEVQQQVETLRKAMRNVRNTVEDFYAPDRQRF